MFDLGLDLSRLEKESEVLIDSMNGKIEEIQKRVPQINMTEYMEAISERFSEQSFMPLDDVWERELGDLFDDLDE